MPLAENIRGSAERRTISTINGQTRMVTFFSYFHSREENETFFPLKKTLSFFVFMSQSSFIMNHYNLTMKLASFASLLALMKRIDFFINYYMKEPFFDDLAMSTELSII